MNWLDIVRGLYNIGDRWIGVDYSKNFLDPEQATLTLVHEAFKLLDICSKNSVSGIYQKT